MRNAKLTIAMNSNLRARTKKFCLDINNWKKKVYEYFTYSMKMLDCDNYFANVNSNFVFSELLSLI